MYSKPCETIYAYFVLFIEVQLGKSNWMQCMCELQTIEKSEKY